MRIAILSRFSRGYSTRRLKQACRARGHTVKVLDPLKLAILVERGRPRLLYGTKVLGAYDAVLPRFGAPISVYGAAVVRQFEQMGVFCLNSSQAIASAGDKLRAAQVLSRHDVGLPPTGFTWDRSQLAPVIAQVGEAPVIIKLTHGSKGVGVILAETTQTAEAVLQTLHSASQQVLIQKFVEESRGRDVRAFVVGDRVVAAMRRVARNEEFRSNVQQRRPRSVGLDQEHARLAIHAAQILGLRVAGVDILDGKDGPQVLDVTASPGLRAIEAATGLDVASSIVELLEEQVSFPDVDLRQRLTLKAGYGVAEFRLTKDSSLCDRTLRSSGLGQREVRVLNVSRGSRVIPNPSPDLRLLPGDLLLCFGKLVTLRSLMPRRRSKHGSSVAARGVHAVELEPKGNAAPGEEELDDSGTTSSLG